MGRQPPRRDAVADRPRAQRGHRPRERGRRSRPAVAAGDGAVWVAGGDAARSCASTRTVARRSRGSRPAAARRRSRSRGGSVWAAGVAPQAAHRGGTLRVRIPSRSRSAPDRLADRYGWTWQTWHLTSLAYDGLVGYRRVGGAGGATLVGALATSAPRADAGRQDLRLHAPARAALLRRHPVRAGDFRASIERFLRVTRGRDSRPSSTRIVGADGAGEPAPCDLSRGDRVRSRARGR